MASIAINYWRGEAKKFVEKLALKWVLVTFCSEDENFMRSYCGGGRAGKKSIFERATAPKKKKGLATPLDDLGMLVSAYWQTIWSNARRQSKFGHKESYIWESPSRWFHKVLDKLPNLDQVRLNGAHKPSALRNQKYFRLLQIPALLILPPFKISVLIMK